MTQKTQLTQIWRASGADDSSAGRGPDESSRIRVICAICGLE
jgi:hypothetical protein